MKTLTWFSASAELKKGDRVRFMTDWDVFPETIIPAGTTATVVENSLNEMQPVLIVRCDNVAVVDALRHWDGNAWLYAPEGNAIDDDGNPIADSEWQEPCAVERA